MSRKSAEPNDGHKPFRVPADEIRKRTVKIQRELQQNGIDGLFIVQRVDLFYFSGTAQNGFLYIPAEGQPTLFIKQYYPRAREESGIDHIVEIASIRDIPHHIAEIYSGMPETLGFELDVLPVKTFDLSRGAKGGLFENERTS